LAFKGSKVWGLVDQIFVSKYSFLADAVALTHADIQHKELGTKVRGRRLQWEKAIVTLQAASGLCKQILYTNNAGAVIHDLPLLQVMQRCDDIRRVMGKTCNCANSPGFVRSLQLWTVSREMGQEKGVPNLITTLNHW
jgi:hypothetical protein